MTVPRPAYHFVPPTGWLNDPNGLVFYAGEYHLFYQWHPNVAVDTDAMYWGHAVSADLVHWSHLPPAIAPDELGSIWSGSAVVDRDNTSGFFPCSEGLVAVFTHHARAGAERQSLAYSGDRGRNWAKFEGNPVLGGEANRDFRDPKVFWHAPSGRWIMIVGVKQSLHASADLKTWTPLGATGFKSECPDLFPLPIEGEAGQAWIDSLAGSHYVVGRFNGRAFGATGEPVRVDGGLDFYASQSWDNEPSGRRIWIGWLNNWKYARQLPDFGATGFMTIPRELTLRRQASGELRLIQRPIRELESLRAQTLGHNASSASTGRLLDGADALEIIATIRPGPADRCGLKVKAAASQETLVGFDASAGSVFVDRTRAGLDLLADRSEAPLPSGGGPRTLRIFVDRLSAEAFFDDGAGVITSLVCSDPSATGLAWFTENGTSGLESLAVHRLA